MPSTTAHFSPSDIATTNDPYPLFAKQRADAPVAMSDGFLLVTGYDAAMEVLRSSSFVTSPIAAMYRDRLPPGAAHDEMSHRINFLDPPDHPRVRGLVSTAFTPRRVTALRPWMEALASELIDGLSPGDAPVDLLAEFAHQLPSLVISEMLGVPPADRERLTAFSDTTAVLLSVDQGGDHLDAAVDAAEEFHRYLEALLEERLQHPGDDLLSALLAAEEDGARLTHPELVSLAATLYSAGHRTTRDLFTNGMATLLRSPERYRAAVDGQWDPAAIVAEFLRYETPTIFIARIAAEHTTIADTDVPTGTPALIYLGAANRDPAVYDRPEEFLPGRDGPPPLSFAFGAHYCLGASLARSEAEVMLTAVTDAWPDLLLAEAEVNWHQRGPFRGVDRLLVGTTPDP